MALAGLIIFPLITTIAFAYQEYTRTQMANMFIVLIAKFDGPEPEKYRVTETVLTRLRTTLKPYEKVVVMTLDRTITAIEGSEEARAEGKKHSASIVIWGWYGATEKVVPVSINFEILCPLKCAPELKTEVQGEIRRIEAAEIENLNFQLELSDEMAFLSLFTVGLFRFSDEDWSEAIVSFTDALNQTKHKEATREVYRYRGLAYINQKKYDLALADLSQALQLDPNYAAAYSDIATLYALQGDFDHAIDDASKAIELNPNGASYYHNRGVFYAEAKHEYEIAISDFDKAIELKPDDPSYYRERGMAFYWIGDYDSALTDFDRAISLYEKEQTSRHADDFKEEFARAHVYRGAIFDARGKYSLALNEYSIAINLKPDYANAYHGRAAVYSHIDDRVHAIEDLRKAIKFSTDPNRLQQMEKELKALLGS